MYQENRILSQKYHAFFVDVCFGYTGKVLCKRHKISMKAINDRLWRMQEALGIDEQDTQTRPSVVRELLLQGIVHPDELRIEKELRNAERTAAIT